MFWPKHGPWLMFRLRARCSLCLLCVTVLDQSQFLCFCSLSWGTSSSWSSALHHTVTICLNTNTSGKVRVHCNQGLTFDSLCTVTNAREAAVFKGKHTIWHIDHSCVKQVICTSGTKNPSLKEQKVLVLLHLYCQTPIRLWLLRVTLELHEKLQLW